MPTPTNRLVQPLSLFFAVATLLAACRAPLAVSPESPTPTSARPLTLAPVNVTPSAPGVNEAGEVPGTPSNAESLIPLATPTPIYSGQTSTACGVQLAPLPSGAMDQSLQVGLSDTTRAGLQAQTPAAAWPALQRLLDAPGTVGLVAFQAGREAEGVYLNADIPMPLISVAKLITLVAYAEAVATGELNSQEQVSLAELDRYYLPNFDLGAHRRAVSELRDSGGVLSPEDNPAVRLEDVAWMMIRHSSNAAADYLHLRLGQGRIEETAVALGLNDPPGSHNAPCAFLGQFLMMANHTRGLANDQAYLSTYTDGGQAEAAAYGREVALLADAYINQADFRQAEQAWRASTRRPIITTQRYFAERLAPRGTAGAYAALMLRLAQNGLGNADSSYQARRILEWPNQFAANQDLFSNIGYKNGSLPGVLATTYYAYRWEDAAPVVVVLFFHDLPQQTYRQWRFDLPHDELARWLLADPSAIPALSAALRDTVSP